MGERRLMKVPKKIKIGAFNYKIIQVDNMAEDFKLLGQAITDRQLIKVEKGSNSQTKDVTLWHEVIHAISDVYNCDTDEHNIDRFAQGLTAIMKNDFGIKFEWD